MLLWEPNENYESSPWKKILIQLQGIHEPPTHLGFRASTWEAQLSHGAITVEQDILSLRHVQIAVGSQRGKCPLSTQEEDPVFSPVVHLVLWLLFISGVMGFFLSYQGFMVGVGESSKMNSHACRSVGSALEVQDLVVLGSWFTAFCLSKMDVYLTSLGSMFYLQN